MDDTRDRAGELLVHLQTYSFGFGSVTIATAGFEWRGSVDDLREAMRRYAAAEATAATNGEAWNE